MTRPLPTLAALVTLGVASACLAGSAADALVAKVPPGSALTLVVEDLRDHSREILKSPLAAGFLQLKAVRAWRASPRGLAWRRTRADLESVLGADLATARDELIGDALVLSLQPPPPGGGPDSARGLLLTKVRDRRLLDRLIASVNAAETASGTLAEVVEKRPSGSSPYFLRRFRPGTKPDEWFTIVEGSTFAWSNSEELIARVAKADPAVPGLGSSPGYRAVRDALPAGSIARLYIDPRFLERMIAASATPGDPAPDAVRSALSAVESAGLSLLWREGPVVGLFAAIDPAKLPPSASSWATRGSSLASLAPKTALAVASTSLNVSAIVEAALKLVPPAAKPKLDAALLAASGLLMGRDARADVLPKIGPGVLAYVVPPTGPDDARFPVVFAVELADGLAPAVENAARTMLALSALDPARPGSRIVATERSGRTVWTLRGPDRTWSVGARPGLLAFGDDPDAVAGLLAAPADRSNAQVAEVKRRFFPDSGTFVLADLERIGREAASRQAFLARALARRRGSDGGQAAADLDRATELLGLFRIGFLAGSIGPEFRSVRATAGLIGRDDPVR